MGRLDEAERGRELHAGNAMTTTVLRPASAPPSSIYIFPLHSERIAFGHHRHAQTHLVILLPLLHLHAPLLRPRTFRDITAVSVPRRLRSFRTVPRLSQRYGAPPPSACAPRVTFGLCSVSIPRSSQRLSCQPSPLPPFSFLASLLRSLHLLSNLNTMSLPPPRQALQLPQQRQHHTSISLTPFIDHNGPDYPVSCSFPLYLPLYAISFQI